MEMTADESTKSLLEPVGQKQREKRQQADQDKKRPQGNIQPGIKINRNLRHNADGYEIQADKDNRERVIKKRLRQIEIDIKNPGTGKRSKNQKHRHDQGAPVEQIQG